jgi:hypothetical protein
MKKPFLTLLGLSLLMSMPGCKDILEEDPQSILVPAFLGTPQGVEAGLTGVYSGYRNIYGNEQAMYMAVTGTDEFMRGIADQDGFHEYDRGLGFAPTSGVVTNQWNNYYQFINDANGVIKYAATVQGIPAARVQQVVAETKLLRAHYYFLMVQQWGDIPLQLEFRDTPTKDIARVPAAQVYDAIIADLTDALAGLPDQIGGYSGVATTGRVTRATALHILAKVYLTRASSVAKQNDDYANAAKYAEELITNQARYGKGLEADPARVFADQNENGKEVLFNIQYGSDATFTQTSDQNYFNGGNASSFFYRSRYEQGIPNMVRDLKNGRPFARFVPTPYLLNSYNLPGETGRQLRTTDTRYNKWFTTTWYVNSPGAAGGSSAAVVGDTSLWYPSYDVPAAALARIANRKPVTYRVILPSQHTREYYPVLNKYDDVRRASVNAPSVRPFIVYRLSETYLIAAEANMYLNNMTKAVDFINVVRVRAAAPGREAQMRITASQLNIDFILDERTRELGGEVMRWMDLVRTGKLIERVKTNPVTRVPATVNKTVPVNGISGTYGSNAAANIQPHHVLRPIPQQDIDRTSGKITQNQGY